MVKANIPIGHIRYGIQENGYENFTGQALVDQFGFLYRENALDVKLHSQVIADLDRDLAELCELLRSKVPLYYHVQLRFPLCTYTFNLFEKVNQLIINRIAPVSESYLDGFLSERQVEQLPYRDKLCNGKIYPLFDVRRLGAEVQKITPAELDTVDKDILTSEIYRLFLRVYKNSMLLINQLASKEVGEMLIVSYEPGAQLNVAEIPDGHEVVGHHHYDHNENAVTRTVGLLGEMCCHIGTHDDNSVNVLRAPGDEVIMNYLAEGFGANQPFHDFANQTDTRTLSLVIDEPPKEGLALLNKLGIFSKDQRGVSALQL